MSHRDLDNLLGLLHEADRTLVEDTSEAKEDLATTVRNLCRDYHVVRAVKRGVAALNDISVLPRPRISITDIRDMVSFAKAQDIPPKIIDGIPYYQITMLLDATPEETPLYAAAAQMLDALKHVAEYLEEVTENNYARGPKPPGLACAEAYVLEAIKTAKA
jgi:hypothetical protein